LNGDPAGPPPPAGRKHGRNSQWTHVFIDDILSMPDKWEYPWFAAWDLAFHCIPLAMVDPEFAKQQLILLTREWYMHPNGQLPAYEWAFNDVNPPVHAWAAWRVYKIEKKMFGRADRLFLERVFQKLLLNFTWWVNRKDEDGFSYDTLHLPDGHMIPLKVRSLVGLIPLFAVETLELPMLFKLTGFSRRLNWFLKHRPDLSMNVTCSGVAGSCDRRILSIVTPDQLRVILRKMLSEEEFLSPHGIRAVSRYHRAHPYGLHVNEIDHHVD